MPASAAKWASLARGYFLAADEDEFHATSFMKAIAGETCEKVACIFHFLRVQIAMAAAPQADTQHDAMAPPPPTCRISRSLTARSR